MTSHCSEKSWLITVPSMPEHPAITVSYTKTLDLQILSCLQCTMLQVSPKSAEFVRDTSFSISSTLYVTACIHPPLESLLIFFPLQSVYINIRIDFIHNLQYSNTTYVYSVLCDWNVELSVWGNRDETCSLHCP